jgi:metal-responsive CopG/Arc/MetJ family transcriptional regulator
MSATQPSGRKVSVGFTQQQWELIDRLKDERRWGATREEIVRNILRDYVKQELGE